MCNAGGTLKVRQDALEYARGLPLKRGGASGGSRGTLRGTLGGRGTPEVRL